MESKTKSYLVKILIVVAIAVAGVFGITLNIEWLNDPVVAVDGDVEMVEAGETVETQDCQECISVEDGDVDVYEDSK